MERTGFNSVQRAQITSAGGSDSEKFTKAKSDVYVISSKADTGAFFKFLDATLHVRHVKPSPTTLLAHAKALEKINTRYNLTRAALKTFFFGAGSKSQSIDNSVLGILPKRLLFAMLRNTDFTGSPDSNPYFFRHFGLNYVAMYVNGRQVPSKGLSLNTTNTKTCTSAYQTLFSGLGIHHGNAGIQITPSQFVRGSFMLIFDLTPDGCSSDGQTSLPDNGSIRIELKFDEALPETVTILLYQEFDATIQIDRLRNILTDF